MLPYIYVEELLNLLRNNQECSDVGTIKLYTAQLLYVFEILHEIGITSGELQPQNILLVNRPYLYMGFRTLGRHERSTQELQGAPFVAPEIRLGLAYTEAVAWWTLGILLAEMLSIESHVV